MYILAPAKVNWFLEVLGKRPDGYHEIVTFMMAVDLCDRLVVQDSVDKSISLEVKCVESFTVGHEEGASLGTGPENLVWQAATLLQQETGHSCGAKLVLEKCIPVGAGLGGGSSDAAATLLLLNAYWGIGLSTTDLAALGARLGSDVTFFLDGAAAWCRGRGELVSPWRVDKVWWLLLVVPPWPVSTAKVYAHVRIPDKPQEVNEFMSALGRQATDLLRSNMFNRLEEAALIAYPKLRQVRDVILQAHLEHVCLSGSGGTFFCLFDERWEAEEAAAKLVQDVATTGLVGLRVHVVPTLTTSQMEEYHTPRQLQGKTTT